MKKYYLILFLFIFNFILPQTRSIIFNTGSPETLDHGYIIDSNNSAANRVFVQNNYVLEAMVFYVTTQSSLNTINVSIREDNNGTPGELISELSEWTFELNPLNPSGYNLIVTTDQCIYLNASSYYWWTIEAANEETDALWIHSTNDYYTVSLNDESNTWETLSLTNAGAGGIWAEQIYDSPYNAGDVNFDFLTNIIDVVNIVNYILDTNELSQESLALADINNDGNVDVIDVVNIVNNILVPPNTNPDFTLEDINPESEYYGESLGPSFFNGQVSCYYFGKQG